ncbi:MAG: membrane lipoprotein lipid attachment site-containing protein [Bacteroidetes bacterium]|jgi:hypothetical protein|nr:membrane lipoprotein lipid attachment site-containing protein [Bacteroidota bacterium]
MKKILFFLGFAIALAGCSEDPATPAENGTESTQVSLVGTWNLEKLVQENGKISLMGTVLSTFTSESSEETGTVQFTEDGNFGSNFGYKSAMTIVTAGQPINSEQDVPPTPIGGTYTHDAAANTFTVTQFDGTVAVANITSLTANELIYTTQINTVVENGGFSNIVTADVTTTLSR